MASRLQELLASKMQLDQELVGAEHVRSDHFDRVRRRRDKVVNELNQLGDRQRRVEEIQANTYRELDGMPSTMVRGSIGNPWDTLSNSEARDSALRMIDTSEPVADMLTTSQRDRLDELIRSNDANTDGGYISRRMVITESPSYRSAWQQLMSEPNPLLSNEEILAVRSYNELERTYSRAMSEGSQGGGGYGVPVFLDSSIIPSSQGSLNPFRRICRSATITTDVWRGVASDGVTWSYDAEAATVSDDTPTLTQPTCSIYAARGFVPFSIEVSTDYPDFANEMALMLARGYDELQADSMVNGNGTTAPRGLITAMNADAATHVVVTTDGTFTGTDINKVWAALPDRAKGNATWVMSHSMGDQIATFGNGNNLSFVTVDLTGVAQTLRARPIAFSSYMESWNATTGAANLLVVGDFSDMIIVDRAGMTVELVPHLVDPTTGRPTGQRGYFAWARHGANVLVNSSFKVLQNT